MIFRTTNNKITAIGSIWDGNGLEFIRELNRLEASYTEIDIDLHTYGGSVFDGNLMINAMEKSNANITLRVIGVAASMGAFALTAVKRVEIVENGYIMIHRPSSGVWGHADDLESEANLLRLMESDFEKRLMKRTGADLKTVKEWLSKDTWFSAQTALEHKLVHAVIPSEVEPIEISEEPSVLGEQEMYNRFAYALFAGIPQLKSNNNSETNMKQLLIAALMLEGLNAQSSDTAVVDAVVSKFNGLKASIDAEKTAKTKAEQDLTAFKASQISAMIETASGKAAAKFTEEEKLMYQKIGENSGVDTLAHVLSAVAKSASSPNFSGKIENEGAEAHADWDFDRWQKEDPKGLERMAEKEPEKFKELFNKKYKN